MSRTDATIVAVLFVAGFALGAWHVDAVNQAGGKPHFYQEQFGAAVMSACGYGYVNPDTATVPTLQAFLSVERDDVPCAQLSGVGRLPLQPMQRAYRYLMTSVAWTWRLHGGVAWSALSPLYGLFYGATTMLLYFVFRIGMGPLMSAVLAAVLAISPLQVMYLVQLRDYSKVPFVLGLVIFAAHVVRAPLSFRRALALAVGAGLFTGLGMGFRNDLLIFIPAFAGTLMFFMPHDQFPRGWRNAAVPAAYVLATILALSPMLSIYQPGGGSSSQHLLVLGLSEPFSNELQMEDGGLYDWGYSYRDEFADAIIAGHASRKLGVTKVMPQYGVDYDRAATQYLRQVAVNFPADLLARVYASTVRILELPYNQELLLPHVEFIRIPHRALVIRNRFQWAMAPLWPWMVGFTLLCLTLSNFRLGLFAVLLLMFLTGYPAIQFGERHFFHLEFVSWWAFGFTVSLIASALLAVKKGQFQGWVRDQWPGPWRPSLLRAAFFWTILGSTLAIALALARGHQQDRLLALFQAYADAPVEAASLESTPTAPGWVQFDPISAAARTAALSKPTVDEELIAIDFGGRDCDSLKLDVKFRYQFANPQYDFSRVLAIQPPLSDTPLRLFFPAYFLHSLLEKPADPSYGLAGVEVPERARSCIMRIGRVVDTDALPVLFELRLPPQWPTADLYETIGGVERRKNAEEVPAVYTFPSDLEVGRQLLRQPIENLAAADIARRSPTLDTDSALWKNAGVGGVGGKGPYLYLFEMKPRHLEAGRLALVQGHIFTGGVSFGLVSNGAWIAQAGVTQPGEFTIVIRVPTTGEHSLILGNNLPGASLRNDLVIRRAGWITPPAP